jgi:fatty acid-binding protein DegV
MLSKVFLAYEMAKKDLPTEQILGALEQVKTDYNVVFIPENLTALKNGGRISPAIALIGNVLGIKPVIKLLDGALEKEGTTKHVRRTFFENIDTMTEIYPVSDYDYSLIAFDAKQEVLDYITANMDEKLGKDNYITGIVPINVCAHCGPGTIGLVISKKIDGKSLKEFL